MRWLRTFALVVCLALLAAALPAWAATNRAEGFEKLGEGARVPVMPLDVELFSISAGGVLEPRADWTGVALTHFRAALHAKKPRSDIEVVDLEDEDDETLESLNRLHGAVSSAIAGHHFGMYALPTKEGRLDWSMGPEVRGIRERTLAAVRAALVTGPVRYSRPALVDQLAYLFENLDRADQRPGADAYARFDELSGELARALDALA